MEKPSTKPTTEREQLERLYNPPPPNKLILKILVCGTIGTFLAVLSIRAIAPNKLPQLVFPSQHENFSPTN